MISRDDVCFLSPPFPKMQTLCIKALVAYMLDQLELTDESLENELFEEMACWPVEQSRLVKEGLVQDLAKRGSMSAQLLEKFMSTNIEIVNISNEDVPSFRVFESPFRPCPQYPCVLELNLQGLEAFRDSDLEIISTIFPNLQSLNVARCVELSADSVSIIAGSPHMQTSLTSLNVSHNQISQESLGAISQLTALRELVMNRCTGFDYINFNLPAGSLIRLELGGVHIAESAELDALVNSQLGSLLVLKLSESQVTGGAFRCPASLSAASEQTSLSLSLQELDLGWCENLDDVCIRGLLDRCTLLEVATLRSTTTDSDCLSVLGSGNPKLVELYAARCVDISDAAVTQVARNGAQLRMVDLSWSLITDVGLRELFAGCPLIEALCLQGCKRLSTAIVDDLLGVCSEEASRTIAARNSHPAGTATDVLLPPPPPESVPTSSALPVLPALPLPLLHFIDFGWVNMFSKQLGVQLSAHRPGLHVVDYYNEVYLDGDAIADFM